MAGEQPAKVRPQEDKDSKLGIELNTVDTISIHSSNFLSFLSLFFFATHILFIDLYKLCLSM